MPNIANAQAIYIVIAFLMPGFIIAVTKSKFTTGRIKTGTEQFMFYIAYSSFSHAMLSWLIYIILFTQLLKSYPLVRAFL